MERTKPSAIKILRTSVHTFLQHYPHFTTTTLLSLPFSTSIFLSSSLLPSLPLLPSFHSQLHSLFDAAGFPSRSDFFSILTLKLSQTLTSSILILPFTLSFLLVAKTSIIQSLNASTRHVSFSRIFNSILCTQIWNTFVIISANATCFWVLFIAFNFLETLFGISSSPNLLLLFSVVGGIGYSVVVANALIVCNLALILSGMEMSGGYVSILKACVLIKGRTPVALSLAIPINIAMAGVERLFQFRIVEASLNNGMSDSTPTPMLLEGFFIAYMYSILITLDTIVGCVFYKSCQVVCGDVDDEDRHAHYCLEIKEDDIDFAYEKLLAKELS